jgi:hypothetical protein
MTSEHEREKEISRLLDVIEIKSFTAYKKVLQLCDILYKLMATRRVHVYIHIYTHIHIHTYIHIYRKMRIEPKQIASPKKKH